MTSVTITEYMSAKGNICIDYTPTCHHLGIPPVIENTSALCNGSLTCTSIKGERVPHKCEDNNNA